MAKASARRNSVRSSSSAERRSRGSGRSVLESSFRSLMSALNWANSVPPSVRLRLFSAASRASRSSFGMDCVLRSSAALRFVARLVCWAAQLPSSGGAFLCGRLSRGQR
eukprot:scaffold41098_cov54-Phaeocystis_antarctica.AAC.4